MTKITIVGAGIAGTAAAIALAQSSAAKTPPSEIEIFEASDSPREVGAGVQIGPNAVKALAKLGITDLSAHKICTPEALCVRKGRSGEVIATAQLAGWIQARHGAPYHTIARADLLAVLLARADELGLRVKYGHSLTRIIRNSGSYQLQFANGSTCQPDGLIGADGLWSTVRTTQRPTTKPHFTGQTAWRALLPRASLPTTIDSRSVTLWLDHGLHAVHYPVSGGQYLNLALFTEGRSDAEGWEAHGDKQDLLHAIASANATLAAPLAELIERADSFIKWPLFALSPAIAWGTGPATMIGDAAHPMLPYLAQGAAMGLEDALCMAETLTGQADFATGFRKFETARSRRVARVQRAARSNARTFHLSGPPAFARDQVLKWSEKISPGALMRRYDWLYGGGPAND